jgi:hypothetical protein
MPWDAATTGTVSPLNLASSHDKRRIANASLSLKDAGGGGYEERAQLLTRNNLGDVGSEEFKLRRRCDARGNRTRGESRSIAAHAAQLLNEEEMSGRKGGGGMPSLHLDADITAPSLPRSTSTRSLQRKSLLLSQPESGRRVRDSVSLAGYSSALGDGEMSLKSSRNQHNQLPLGLTRLATDADRCGAVWSRVVLFVVFFLKRYFFLRFCISVSHSLVECKVSASCERR